MPEPRVATRRDFPLADLGEGLEEATIVEWLVAVGDRVELNQVVCNVETAKAEVEVPSPWAGTVVALGGAAGETIAVGAPLVTIEVADEAADRAETASASGRQPTLVGYGVDESADQSRRARAVARHRRNLAQASDESAVPVRGVRARIAERMTTSAAVPTASASVVVDCTRLLEVRTMLDDHAERHGRDRVITPFALICRVVVEQLGAVPLLNATYAADVDGADGAEIRVHSAVHLGIGTATDRGLVVTVVRDAQQRGVHDLATELARLATGARAGTLPPTDLVGSTFTVSNFGALGLDSGQPLLNPPEAGILGVGAIRRRPHVVDDEVVPRATASLTLVFDHRVVDGAEAGRFLGGLRELVEAPELALFGA